MLMLSVMRIMGFAVFNRPHAAERTQCVSSAFSLTRFGGTHIAA
jgi:hypothetical protein